MTSAIEVYRELGGPGLLEDVYEEALAHELELRSLCVQRQVPVQVTYKNKKIKQPLCIDLLGSDSVIIEVNAVGKHHQILNLNS